MNPRITGPAGASVDPVSRESLAQDRLSYSGQKTVVPNTDRTHASQLPDPGVRDTPGLPARKSGNSGPTGTQDKTVILGQ